MLNRARVLQALSGLSSSTYDQYHMASQIARETWDRISRDQEFLSRAKAVDSPWALPSWHGVIDQQYPVSAIKPQYQCMSVDGSQVYPDRHQGSGYYLINIGSIVISYGAQNPVSLASSPFIYTGLDSIEYEQANIHEVINCMRQELELAVGLELCITHEAVSTDSILLFDGALIFWNLEAKNSVLSTLFFEKYIRILSQLYASRYLYAGYISVPRSRELCNILKLALCNFNTQDHEAYRVIDPVVDATVASFFLQPCMRTTVFGNNAAISSQYPAMLRPHFFYMHVGTEIGRVEIPGWIAQDTVLVDLIASCILDQCNKGGGYPVVLAEAHEQAVVKGPDREFFYQALQQESARSGLSSSCSPKEQRKRRMGI